MKVVVIGAGVVGLSTAVCIQETYANCDVTVMSEKFPPEDIVSLVAGGVILGTIDPSANKDTQIKSVPIDSVLIVSFLM